MPDDPEVLLHEIRSQEERDRLREEGRGSEASPGGAPGGQGAAGVEGSGEGEEGGTYSHARDRGGTGSKQRAAGAAAMATGTTGEDIGSDA